MNLQQAGCDTIEAVNGLEANDLAVQRHPAAVVLDVMMPDLNGFEVCRTIRKTSSVPVVMLTARGEVTDRIVGLEIAINSGRANRLQVSGSPVRSPDLSVNFRP